MSVIEIKNRKSNYELLRIVGMIMIIAHHYAVHGIEHIGNSDIVYLDWANGTVVNRIIVSLMEPGGGYRRCPFLYSCWLFYD